MSNLYITTWENAASVALGVPKQFLTAAIAGVNSAKITGDTDRQTRKCRLYAEIDCWVKWGAAPIATGATDAIPLFANTPEYFEIESGFVITAIVR